MLDPLSGPELPENLIFFVLKFFRNQPEQGLANHLLGRIAKHPPRTLVPALDDSIQVFADDGILSGINDGGEPEAAVIEPLATTDVPRDLGGAHNPACVVSYRRDGHGDGKLLAVF